MRCLTATPLAADMLTTLCFTYPPPTQKCRASLISFALHFCRACGRLDDGR
ncbi:MAG: hypothetical protein LBC73_06370 [Oscillospiraceae bacterium]|nr:hypothetical protein [Oscillospiraceae bacterium]